MSLGKVSNVRESGHERAKVTQLLLEGIKLEGVATLENPQELYESGMYQH